MQRFGEFWQYCSHILKNLTCFTICLSVPDWNFQLYRPYNMYSHIPNIRTCFFTVMVVSSKNTTWLTIEQYSLNRRLDCKKHVWIFGIWLYMLYGRYYWNIQTLKGEGRNMSDQSLGRVESRPKLSDMSRSSPCTGQCCSYFRGSPCKSQVCAHHHLSEWL